MAYIPPSPSFSMRSRSAGGLVGIGPVGPVALILGLREMHETDTWRVVLAVLLPMLVCCACIGGGIAIALAGAGAHLPPG